MSHVHQTTVRYLNYHTDTKHSVVSSLYSVLHDAWTSSAPGRPRVFVPRGAERGGVPISASPRDGIDGSANIPSAPIMRLLN